MPRGVRPERGPRSDRRRQRHQPTGAHRDGRGVGRARRPRPTEPMQPSIMLGRGSGQRRTLRRDPARPEHARHRRLRPRRVWCRDDPSALAPPDDHADQLGATRRGRTHPTSRDRRLPDQAGPLDPAPPRVGQRAQCCPPSGPERRRPACPTPLRRRPGAASAATFLLVEDNLVNQKVFIAMMASTGYRVDVAATGSRRSTRSSAHEYAAVFMDCQMPVMDGYQTTERLREREGPRSPNGHHRGDRLRDGRPTECAASTPAWTTT